MVSLYDLCNEKRKTKTKQIAVAQYGPLVTDKTSTDALQRLCSVPVARAVLSLFHTLSAVKSTADFRQMPHTELAFKFCKLYLQLDGFRFFIEPKQKLCFVYGFNALSPIYDSE